GDTGEEGHAEIHQRTAVHFGEPDLQHHLLRVRGAGDLQHVDDVGFRDYRTGNLGCPQHNLRARDAAGQHHGIGVDVAVDVFAREQQVQLLLERRNRLVDDDVVLGPEIVVPPDDEADRAGGLAIHEDFARLDDDG